MDLKRRTITLTRNGQAEQANLISTGLPEPAIRLHRRGPVYLHIVPQGTLKLLYFTSESKSPNLILREMLRCLSIERPSLLISPRLPILISLLGIKMTVGQPHSQCLHHPVTRFLSCVPHADVGASHAILSLGVCRRLSKTLVARIRSDAKESCRERAHCWNTSPFLFSVNGIDESSIRPR